MLYEPIGTWRSLQLKDACTFLLMLRSCWLCWHRQQQEEWISPGGGCGVWIGQGGGLLDHTGTRWCRSHDCGHAVEEHCWPGPPSCGVGRGKVWCLSVVWVTWPWQGLMWWWSHDCGNVWCLMVLVPWLLPCCWRTLSTRPTELWSLSG